MSGILLVFAGLALFMFGIKMLSAGMEKLVGDQIRKWLDRVVNGRLKSAAFGAVATAALQSNGLLMVTLEGAIAIILGANIGSCITGLTASLKLSSAARQASMAQILRQFGRERVPIVIFLSGCLSLKHGI